MTKPSLKTYLSDHLAGAVAALQLLEHLASLHRGGAHEAMFQGLYDEIAQDRDVLRRLLRETKGQESPVRKAAAWLTEKLGELKLRVDDPSGSFHVFEALETLGLGIQGKLALWRALRAARLPEVGGLDFAELERKAMSQFARVDEMRLALARAALRGPEGAERGATVGG